MSAFARNANAMQHSKIISCRSNKANAGERKPWMDRIDHRQPAINCPHICKALMIYHQIHRRPCFIDPYTPLIHKGSRDSSMKMFVVLAVLALAAAAASAQQVSWDWLQPGMYGAGGVYHCAELLRQPQCSPAAAPYYLRREQTMWQPSAVCQPLRQRCCQQLSLMDPMSRCQAMCGVAQSVAQQLQGGAGAGAGALYDPPPPAALMRQWQQLLPAAQAPMAVAQAAQSLPAMCGLYPLPGYCTTPCALSAAVNPPYYY